jgi:hypothetical protein
MGSGIGSIPVNRMIKAIDELIKATVPGGFQITTKTVPLSDVEHVWSTAESLPRTVFQIP